MSANCYVCGSPAVSSASDIGASRCEDCAPIRDHIVSMQTANDGASLAVCQCGWRSKAKGPKRYFVQEVKVRLHWRSVIGRIAEATAEQVLA